MGLCTGLQAWLSKLLNALHVCGAAGALWVTEHGAMPHASTCSRYQAELPYHVVAVWTAADVWQ